MPRLDSEQSRPYLAATQHWLSAAVIGLNLCPFAKAVHVKKQIEYRFSNATDPADLLNDLRDALQSLASADANVTDTSLLIHPFVLQDFFAFNDFLLAAEDLLAELELEGVLQIASFHPDYQFADAAADDITNYTNRSPYPTLHLIREESISRAVAAIPNPDAIYEVNKDTLRRLGLAGWRALLANASEG